MGAYSAKRFKTGDDSFETRADPKGNVIAFAFIEGGREVNTKYRTASKAMWQRVGGRKTFFNADVLDDPALAEDKALVIVEGEPDCMATVDSGYPWCVSVPDGAPPARDKEGNLIVVPQTADKIDPENDDKFKFLVNNWDRLARVKRIIIAVDDDESGQRLAAELVRRLGRVRCSFVTYPPDRVVPGTDGALRPCKDLNEVKHHLGAEAVVRTLLLARPYPMSGLFRLYDFPQEQPIVYHHTGWRALDAHLRPFYPALMTITGLAGAGKSTFAMQLGIDMARIHKWPLAIASPEMARLEVVDTLRRAYLRDNPDRCSIEEVEDVDEWINSSVVFIDPDPVEDETHDVRWFLDRAAAAVVRYGCRQVILDPWNEIEHQRTGSENITEYTSRALRDIKAFNRSFGCMTTIVAHPSAKAADKRPDQIGLYDVSDSAHFANKSDIGIVVTRLGSNGEGASLGSIGVRKIKYQGTDKGGYLGTAQLMFDEERRVFFD